MEFEIKVYVKVNENNEITEITSSVFLQDTKGWIEIDEGCGDKYAHAQGNYLDKPLTDEQGRYNYMLFGDEVMEIAEADKPIIEVIPQVTMEERLAAVEDAMLEMVLGGMM